MRNYLYANRNMFALVLLIFSICNSLFIESRVSDAAAAPSIPLVPKKPPFNGSIYGKRSSWPALRGIQDFSDYSNQELSYLQDLASGISDSPVAIMMKQQQFESATDLIRAAINLCLSEQQISNTEANLCAELIANKQVVSKRSRAGDVWLARLMGQK